MYKTVVILYLVVFVSYVLFTRQPDYFNGETINGEIHFVKDSTTGDFVPKAFFTLSKKQYAVNAGYTFRTFSTGEKVPIIYELAAPEKGAVYSWWGYWIRWQEVVASIILLLVLFQIAVGITKNPTPGALIEELESKPPRKRKYI